MDGDRKAEAEFTTSAAVKVIEAQAIPHREASRARLPKVEPGKRSLISGREVQGEASSAMPERLRRKYYVAEAGAGNEAKVYADPKGEYLAFKITSERMATRLEDASVIRDMVSIAQHRSWKEVELRGSEEFRRSAWIEASVRGLSVHGYEPDPVDRAALSFRTRGEERSSGASSQPRQTEPEARKRYPLRGVRQKGRSM